MVAEVALDGGCRSQVGYKMVEVVGPGRGSLGKSQGMGSSLLGLRYSEPMVLEDREVETFRIEDPA